MSENFNSASSIEDNMVVCTHDTIVDILIDSIYSRRPTIIWGNTGVGKTQLLHAVARMFGINPLDRSRYIDQRMSSCDAPDVRGCIFPDHATGRTVVFPPKWIPSEMDGLLRMMVFEEINAIQDETVQAALYEMLQERRNGDIDIAPETAMFATANLEEDHGPTVELAGPVKNRVKHVRLQNTVACWLKMAEESNYHPFLTAYIRRFGIDTLYAPDFNKNAFPTNRTWSDVNSTITNPLYQSTLKENWKYAHHVTGFILPKFPDEFEAPVPTYESIVKSIGTSVGAAAANKFSLFVTQAQSVLPLMETFDAGRIISESDIVSITDQQYYALLDMMRRTMINRREQNLPTTEVFIKNMLGLIMHGARSSSLLTSEFRQAGLLRMNQSMNQQFTTFLMRFQKHLGEDGRNAVNYFREAGIALSEMAA